MVTVAGGSIEQTTEFLNLEEYLWHYGSNLPYGLQDGASVQLENTFMNVEGGGTNGTTTKLDTI